MFRDNHCVPIAFFSYGFSGNSVSSQLIVQISKKHTRSFIHIDARSTIFFDRQSKPPATQTFVHYVQLIFGNISFLITIFVQTPILLNFKDNRTNQIRIVKVPIVFWWVWRHDISIDTGYFSQPTGIQLYLRVCLSQAPVCYRVYVRSAGFCSVE